MIINIDDSAGFCWGVVQTIDKVEAALTEYGDKTVHVLGQIIHNPKEGERLEARGLHTIGHEDFKSIDPKNSVVIIRAHGEPPTTYQKAEELGLEIIDATCPLVKTLQNTVKNFFIKGWQIVIYGKIEHAEVIGIRGVCNDECIVVKNLNQAMDAVDFSKKTVLFSQTTMDRQTFTEISDGIQAKFQELYPEEFEDYYISKNSLCKFVSKREDKLIEFANSHELVIFVAGKNSSNGKILYDICKSANSNTKFIEDTDELDFDDVSKYQSIGITGATSTPQWFMESIKDLLENKFNKN